MGGESGNDGIVISIGTVERSGVRDGRSYVEIMDGRTFPSRFVFSNNDRKARGNHVKKLKLKKGQTVIAIGARRRFDEIIGWELFRDSGIVSNGVDMAMIGTLKRKMVSGGKSLIVVRLGGRDYNFNGTASCELNRKVAVRAKFNGGDIPDVVALRQVEEKEDVI